MRLALATRHRVERPAMSMEGGTINPMERLPAAVWFAFEKYMCVFRFALSMSANFVISWSREMCFTVKHIKLRIRQRAADHGCSLPHSHWTRNLNHKIDP